jgi:uncharacterized protein YkwD
MGRRATLLATTVTMLGCVGLADSVAAFGGVTAQPTSRGAHAPVRSRTAPRRESPRSLGRARTARSHAGCRPRGHRSSHRARSSSGGCRTRRGLPSHALVASNTLRAALIASALATLCQNTELMPEQANLALIRAAVLCLINRLRAQNSEGPLALSGQLDQAAEDHSREMVSEDYFQHVSPAGITPVDRVRTDGYIPSPDAGYVIGENIAWGTFDLATPQAIVTAWAASPAHLANILEGHYRDTGIGVAPQAPAALGKGAPGATYSQEFGVIVG